MDFDWRSIAGAVAPFAPKLGTVLGSAFGPFGGVIGGLAGNVIASTFGVPPTPEAVGTAIAQDPKAQEKLEALEAEHGQAILAQAQVAIEQAKQYTEQFRIAAEDTQSARTAQATLVDKGSILAYGPSILSLLIIVGFFTIIVLFLNRPPTMTEATLSIVSLLIGKLSSAFDTAVQYYLGSSAGSRDKNEMLKQVINEKQVVVPEVKGKKRT